MIRRSKQRHGVNNPPPHTKNLSFDKVVKTPSFDVGGGGKGGNRPPIFIWNKCNKIMHCVGYGHFHVLIYLISIYMWVDITPPIKTKLKYVKNAHISKLPLKKDQHSA